MELEERHALFAASLALILPDPVICGPGTTTPGENLTPEILHAARRGHYHDCGQKHSWPYYFTGQEYCGHLHPIVIELWRAAYE